MAETPLRIFWLYTPLTNTITAFPGVTPSTAGTLGTQSLSTLSGYYATEKSQLRLFGYRCHCIVSLKHSHWTLWLIHWPPWAQPLWLIHWPPRAQPLWLIHWAYYFASPTGSSWYTLLPPSHLADLQVTAHMSTHFLLHVGYTPVPCYTFVTYLVHTHSWYEPMGSCTL